MARRLGSARFGKKTVLRTDGSEVALEECWKTAPAVVVFIRHFG